MRFPKALTMPVAGALALSLSLAACGGTTGGATAETETAVVQGDEVADAPEREGKDVTDEDDSDPENVDVDERMSREAEGWVDAWTGESSLGRGCYYTESPDGTEGIMVVYDAGLGGYVSYAGRNRTDGATGEVTLTDEASGLALTYTVIGVEGDVVTIDLGGAGTVELRPCNVGDVLGVFRAASAGGSEALVTARDADALRRSLQVLTSGWTHAWMGESTTGELYYYAEAPQDKDDVLMVIADPKTRQYLSFVGTTCYDEETGYLTTTDDSRGISITYEVSEATDEGVVLDVGDYGTVTLGACSVDELIEAFVTGAAGYTAAG